VGPEMAEKAAGGSHIGGGGSHVGSHISNGGDGSTVDREALDRFLTYVLTC
jgi:hypothetical protein